MKYECPICGYVYDESAEGAAWESLPDSWECPVCHAPKSVFKEVKEPEPAKKESAPKPETDTALPLTAAELSAICSNLARGCEKQYMDKERALFMQLAEHYSSLIPPADGDISQLAEAVKADADAAFDEAKRAALSDGDRGAQRALVWGERVNFVLQSLIERYGENAAEPEKADIWVCSVCGFIFIGEVPPEICPVCKVPSFKFERGGKMQ